MGSTTVLVGLASFRTEPEDLTIARPLARATAFSFGGPGFCAAAPLDLPNGATITKAGIRVRDDSSTDDVGMMLYRNVIGPADGFEMIAPLVSTGAPGVTTLQTTTIAEAHVDTTVYVYSLMVCGYDEDLELFGGAVTYTNP